MLETLTAWVWGPGLLVLLLGTGLWLSFQNRFFQLWDWKRILSCTFGSLRRNRHESAHQSGSMTQLQTFSTALAAAMGTGNLIGVAAALLTGGSGAIFWMWISALLGMMLTYQENVLGKRFARQRADGTWVGGPMAYLQYGLHAPVLAVLYSIFCLLASLGMGNMTQSSTIAQLLEETFSIPPIVPCIALPLIFGAMLRRGRQSTGKVLQWLMPILAGGYMLSALAVILLHWQALPRALSEIFQGAFGLRAAGGGAVGITLQKAMGTGLRHGVFSNEAGLGSSALVHAGANSKNPELQGLWSMTEVALDTLVCCMLTALAILTSGAMETARAPGQLLADAFSGIFGEASAPVLAIITALFAFCTLGGWCCCGEQAAAYLLGKKRLPFYRMLFCLAAGAGAVLSLQTVWTLSDLANGLMAIPNLLGLLLLSTPARQRPAVSRATRKTAR